MLKKTIKYVDYDGNEREEDFYFNMSRVDLTNMNYDVSGGMVKFLNKIISERDEGKLLHLFQDIILRAYGEKSMDGKRFIKNDELREAFSQTEAYVNLFTEFMQDTESFVAFVKGILPADVAAEIEKQELNSSDTIALLKG